jgi:orotate phosphoribosyltransferase
MNSEFIEFLVRTGALKFGEFTLKSGRKSPYFVNTGVISSGADLNMLAGFFAAKIKEVDPTVKTIFGPAYKGIPLAVATSISLSEKYRIQTNWLFNRKEIKTHGDAGAFVGKLPEKEKEVILVDDVFTTGGTKYEAVNLLSAMGIKISYMVVGVDRQEKGKEGNAVDEFVEETGVPVHVIANISDAFEYLHGRKIGGKVAVDDKLYAAFKKYRDEYGA